MRHPSSSIYPWSTTYRSSLCLTTQPHPITECSYSSMDTSLEDFVSPPAPKLPCLCEDSANNVTVPSAEVPSTGGYFELPRPQLCRLDLACRTERRRHAVPFDDGSADADLERVPTSCFCSTATVGKAGGIILDVRLDFDNEKLDQYLQQ